MIVRFDELLNNMGTALDVVEGELLGTTTNHGKRIAVLSSAMARYLGLDEPIVRDIVANALLHDNALTEYILSERPGKHQAANLKVHCDLGQRNVELLPFGKPAKDFVRYHHERPDGKGPHRLHGDSIPLGAAIIATADKVDAELNLQRLQPEELDDVLTYIRKSRGTVFTTESADALLAVLDLRMLENLRDEMITGTYAQTIPKWTVELRGNEIIRIAGFASRIIDYKSRFTCLHSSGIANIAWQMGNYFGYGADARNQLYLAASLHDIGKLWTPTSILEKPGALTSAEFSIIKAHARHTYDVLSGISGFEQICGIAASHHEKLDGKGYPFGRRAAALSREERLLGCIDIYQAVSEERPYHPARSHKETMPILKGLADAGQIDGEIVEALDEHLAQYSCNGVPGPPGAVLCPPEKQQQTEQNNIVGTWKTGDCLGMEG